ncbi:MAG: class I SAM-dependent methyltransferase, partial [Candidatus Acidiferrales bacterium]
SHTRDAAHAAGTHAATDPLSCHSERSEESAFRTEAGQSKSNGGAQSSTELHRGATIWGSDFAHPMLVRAREKASHRSIRLVEADALALPWPDTSLDLVTAAFGFRNLANYEAGLREIHRVLKPGGEVGILEFAAPRSRMIAALYRLYLTQILPRAGGAVSGSRAAYSYLPASVMKFPPPEELQAQMRAIGFSDPRTDLWTLGVVALHTASKP